TKIIEIEQQSETYEMVLAFLLAQLPKDDGARFLARHANDRELPGNHQKYEITVEVLDRLAELMRGLE
ncbi:MAG: hypothetical protein ORN98_10820, partial [Alphaproteobacteria bacterium]|nr:hypothetical protein [Alphaproteobacteria bacterium]